MEKKWYVVTTFSNHEKKVKSVLEERIAQKHMEDHFGEILVPTETVKLHKDGKTITKEKTSYPGYVFVEMLLSDDVWHLIRNVPKVTGFIGDENPKPVDRDKLLKPEPTNIKAYREFEIGNKIQVIDGAFTNFSGLIETIDLSKQKAKITISVFGRDTSVEMSLSSIQRIA